MQEPQALDLDPPVDNRSTIDTSRPFRSVKEAVAIFGERFLVGEIYTSKTFTFPQKETPFFSPSPNIDKSPHFNSTPSPTTYETTSLSDTMKKLEMELEDTKNELKLLKERECENEVALASLNAELHKNMSKVAAAEAVVAGRRASGRGGDVTAADHGGVMIMKEEEKKRDAYLSGASTRLAEILSIGEEEGLFVGRKKEKKKVVKKKKPIVPLIGDLFFRKKGTSSNLHSPHYSSSHLQWNF